jgi:glutathione S-transferase
MTLKLIIGNKNYSSWSFRPWLAMKVVKIEFDEEVICLTAPEFKPRLNAIGGSGKVPVLIDGPVRVWESLAILEYLAERFSGANLWPADAATRADARAIAAEMHAGFGALRRELPMNMRRVPKARALSAEAQQDVRRIEAIWALCRSRSSNAGPFLFGPFGAADAMYAPVVSRFQTYGVDVGRIAQAYMQEVMALPAWSEWQNGRAPGGLDSARGRGGLTDAPGLMRGIVQQKLIARVLKQALQHDKNVSICFLKGAGR